MEESNVNRLNGVANFGHGLPEEQITSSEEYNEEKEGEKDVAGNGGEAEEVNG